MSVAEVLLLLTVETDHSHHSFVLFHLKLLNRWKSLGYVHCCTICFAEDQLSSLISVLFDLDILASLLFLCKYVCVCVCVWLCIWVSSISIYYIQTLQKSLNVKFPAFVRSSLEYFVTLDHYIAQRSLVCLQYYDSCDNFSTMTLPFI